MILASGVLHFIRYFIYIMELNIIVILLRMEKKFNQHILQVQIETKNLFLLILLPHLEERYPIKALII